MDNKPFRVLLDVTDLLIEPFKRIWLYISPQETRNVSDLKSLIKKKLNLPSKKFLLYVREGLLLDEETICVLRDDDVVRVEYVGKLKISSQGKSKPLSLEKEKSFKENSITNEHETHKLDENNFKDKTLKIKKRKKCQQEDGDYYEPDRESKTEFYHKIKKHKKNHDHDSISNDKEEHEAGSNNKNNTDDVSLKNCYSTCSNNSDTREKYSKRKDKSNSLSFDLHNEGKTDVYQNDSFTALSDCAVASTIGVSLPLTHKEKSNIMESRYSIEETNCQTLAINHVSAQSNPIHSNSTADSVGLDNEKSNSAVSKPTPKKKRKRKRKRKDPAPEAVFPLDLPHVDISTVSTALLCPERKHVLFSPPKQQKESVCQDIEVLKFDFNIPKNTFDSYSASESLFSNKLPLSATTSTPVQKEEIRSLVCDAPVIQKIESAHFLNSKASITKETTENPKLPEKSTAKEFCNGVNDSTQLNFHDLPPLSCLPKVGTKIAYKVLELDENYSPVVSDFRVGIVKEINQMFDEMIIDLVKPIVKPGRIGKFELLKELEEPPPEIITEESLCWNALIDPKLLT